MCQETADLAERDRDEAAARAFGAVASLPGQDGAPPGWTRYLLVRRSLTRNARGEPELAYYLCCAPAGTTDEDLIRVAGSRWAGL